VLIHLEIIKSDFIIVKILIYLGFLSGFLWFEGRRQPNWLAEAVRFELTKGANPCRFSRPVPSTARPRFHLQNKTDGVAATNDAKAA
jgi:hypothetical protein